MVARSGDIAELDSELLHALVNHAVDGIIAIDDRGLVRLMNPAAEDLFGYRSQEVVGHNVSMLMPEPYRSRHDDYLNHYLKTGERRIMGVGREVEGRRRDGTTFPMYLSVAEVHAPGQRLFTGIVHDLTARKRAEEELRRERDKVESYLDIAGAIVVAINADQKVTLINREGCQILGYTADQIVGRNWFDHFVPESVRDALKALFRQFIDGKIETGEYYENPVLCSNGRERIIAWHNATLRDEHGQIIGTLSSGDDVTEQRRATHEVQRIRAYLKNIVDSMPSVLVGVDSGGRVTEWNRHAEQTTGVTGENAIGRKFSELLPQLESHLALVQRAVRNGEPVTGERLLSEQEGEARYSDVVVYPLTGDGNTGAVIRVDDVTNRVRVEQMMVQTEKMMSVGGLAAGMAHEINNPLSAVLQSSQNILRRLSKDLPANRRAADALDLDLDRVHRYLEQRGILHFLDGIHDSATRATRIVGDMLSFSRRSETELTPARVEEMLDVVVRLAASDYDLKKRYDFRQIRVVREYAPKIPEVPCDRTEIEQVFLNIIKNAAQAMATGGRRPYRLTLRTHREGNFVRIDIEDNGPGMDRQTQDRVFEPFFTTKPVGTGTGLGLSVSYFIIVEQHHGSLTVSSAPDKGARFTVRLPLRDRARRQ